MDPMYKRVFKAWVRSKTRPIKENTAYKWRKRLSIMYMLIAWNLGTYAMYICFKDRYPNLNVSSKEEYEKMMNFQNLNKATFIRFNGFQKVDELKLDLENNENNETTA